MKHLKSFLSSVLLACVLLAPVHADESPLMKIPLTDIDGKVGDLTVWKDYVVLVVNVASECGYTRQYEGLEKIYQQYKDRSFSIMAFPCNDFGNQEPAKEKQIKSFCTGAYNVKFQLMSKISIRSNPHPFFEALTGPKSPFPGPVHWNFNKFLIGRDGTLKARFDSDVEPESIQLRQAIEKELAATKR
jgi:glutathione peroxidase